MPKTSKRKKVAGRPSALNREVQSEIHAPSRVKQPGISLGSPSQQNVIFSLMVALGFWGMAIFCVFFFAADPNHYLYGGIMALTAIGWSILVARKWSAYRQGVHA